MDFGNANLGEQSAVLQPAGAVFACSPQLLLSGLIDKGEGSSQCTRMTHSTSAGWFTRCLLAGTGRPLLCSIVFLNAFLNNSKRKHYFLASSHPGHLLLPVLRMQKLGSAKTCRGTRLQLFLSVFQINRCLLQ